MSIRHAVPQDNPFLTAPIGRIFRSNALSMAVVLSMGGLLSLVDALIVGRLVGPGALASVSLAFPVTMVLSALSTLVGGGMSSLLARHLGAGQRVAAGQVFAGAQGLALALAAGLGLVALATGAVVIAALAPDPAIADGTRAYLRILLLGAPVQLVLGVHADALRNEGRAGLIAGLSVLVNLINMAANWVGIAVLGLGLSGSALGTVLAQALGLALVAGVRARDRSLLPLAGARAESWLAGWGPILRLGLPLSLGFLGIAATSGVVLGVLRQLGGTEGMVAAYGLVTRCLGFAFLPQMAIALTIQSLTGTNAGAGQQARVRAALRLGLATAFLWSLTVVGVGLVLAGRLGGWFSADPAVTQSLPLILRPMLTLYAASGPILVLALHFQAQGQPGKTAVLTLVKPWLLTPALILTLSALFGVTGLWLAFPVADAVILGLAVLLWRGARKPEEWT